MNAKDLRTLKEWRERGGLSEEEFFGLVEAGGDPEIDSPLQEMETNMALALHDFLVILGVGDEDIAEVMGKENMAYIEELLAERPPPVMDEGVRAYRSAKTLFEPEKGLEEYGLMPTSLRFSDRIWDALDETEDDHFVCKGPLVFDQNTRTVWLWGGDGAIEAMLGPMRLEQDQLAFAIAAMKEAGGGLLEASIP